MQYLPLTALKPRNAWGIALVSLVLLMSHCKEEEPTYPIEPNIQSAKAEFVKRAKEYLADTLKITLIYTDGDGDVGLDFNNADHNDPPFHEYTYYLRSTGEAVTSDKLIQKLVLREDLISYKDRHNPPFDTLPPESSCRYSNGLYIIRNENFTNLELNFFRRESSGNYVQYPFEESCIFLGVRMPTAGTRNMVWEARSISRGRVEVVFKMLSGQFEQVFGGDILKLGLQIKDRSLHTSNYFMTEDFVFQ